MKYWVRAVGLVLFAIGGGVFMSGGSSKNTMGLVVSNRINGYHAAVGTGMFSRVGLILAVLGALLFVVSHASIGDNHRNY